MLEIELENYIGSKYHIDSIVSKCPYCHKIVSFGLSLVVKTNLKRKNCDMAAFLRNRDEDVCDYYDVYAFILKCRDAECGCITVSYYYQNNKQYFNIQSFPKEQFLATKFSDIIKSISQNFTELYNQSEKANAQGCDKIAGAGYRKALEFLVKDYAIKYNNAQAKSIKEMPLSQAIEKYMPTEKLKEIAKRALWLGNDEVHYEKIWNKTDITLLINTIDIVIHHIVMEETGKNIISSMPNPKQSN